MLLILLKHVDLVSFKKKINAYLLKLNLKIFLYINIRGGIKKKGCQKNEYREIYQVCDNRRWGSRKNLYAHFLHQQYLSNRMLFFFFPFF